jgi:hypothetical protein
MPPRDSSEHTKTRATGLACARLRHEICERRDEDGGCRTTITNVSSRSQSRSLPESLRKAKAKSALETLARIAPARVRHRRLVQEKARLRTAEGITAFAGRVLPSTSRPWVTTSVV